MGRNNYVPADQFSMSVINRYLELKGRMQL